MDLGFQFWVSTAALLGQIAGSDELATIIAITLRLTIHNINHMVDMVFISKNNIFRL